MGACTVLDTSERWPLSPYLAQRLLRAILQARARSRLSPQDFLLCRSLSNCKRCAPARISASLRRILGACSDSRCWPASSSVKACAVEGLHPEQLLELDLRSYPIQPLPVKMRPLQLRPL